MAENITTVPLLDDAENLSQTDLLYLIQGLNADRDRKLTLGMLRDYIQTVFNDIILRGGGNHPNITEITPAGISVSGMGGETVLTKQALATIFLTAYSLALKNSNKTVTLSIDAANERLVIDKTVSVEGNIEPTGSLLIERGSSAEHNHYSIQVNSDRIVIDGPGGTTSISMTALTTFGVSANQLRVSSDAVIEKLTANSLVLNFNPLEQEDDNASQERYRTMTYCEAQCTSGWPTEYYTGVCPGTSGYQGNSDFTMNSTSHPVGQVVMVTNTGKYGGGSNSPYPIAVYQAWDTGLTHSIAQIPYGSSKCFIYKGLDSNNLPLWVSL